MFAIGERGFAKLWFLWQSLTAFMIQRKGIIAAVLIATVALLTAAGAPAAEPSSVIARIHTIGMQRLAGDTNAAYLRKLFNLPESAQLRGSLLHSFATAAPRTIGYKPVSTNGCEQLLKPLISDLFSSETILELNNNQQTTTFNIAVDIDEATSTTWSSNLNTVINTWTGKSDKLPTSSKWKRQLSPTVGILFAREGHWTIISSASDAEYEQFADKLRKKAFALVKDNWVAGTLDWPRIEKAFGISIPFKIARTQFEITGKGENLHTTIRAELPEKFNFQPEPWVIPTVVRDPLVSFTALQRVASFCKSSKFFEQIGLNPLTRECYFWAQADLPFQTFGAIHSNNATNELKAISTRLIAAANPRLVERHSGQLGLEPDGYSVAWTNVPLMAPYLRPFSDNTGQYLVLGMFPRAPMKTPPPTELLNQIRSNPKLIYYDWEITENRIGHWDMLSRALPVFSPETLPPGRLRLTRNSRSPAHIWLRAVAPMLGNTITEIAMTGPQEVTLKRKSNIGLTGMELTYFVNLLDEKLEKPPMAAHPPTKRSK